MFGQLVIELGRLTSETQLPDELVSADGVEVHDLHVEGAVPDLLPGHVELEGGVEDGVQVALVHRGLLLLHPFLPEHQPHLHVWIWGKKGKEKEKEMRKNASLYS